MKRRILSLMLLCMLALPMAMAQGTKKIELTFFYPVQVGGPLTKLIEKICSDFTAENPNIVVKPVYTGN
ncbi:ABC transporter substrate-binding protein, partial [bacterium]|nr:ABC transporter substrate-binding protein [bacterium]